MKSVGINKYRNVTIIVLQQEKNQLCLEHQNLLNYAFVTNNEIIKLIDLHLNRYCIVINKLTRQNMNGGFRLHYNF